MNILTFLSFKGDSNAMFLDAMQRGDIQTASYALGNGRVFSGADVNAKDAQGKTAMDYATAENKTDAIEFLLSNGATKPEVRTEAETPNPQVIEEIAEPKAEDESQTLNQEQELVESVAPKVDSRDETLDQAAYNSPHYYYNHTDVPSNNHVLIDDVYDYGE